MEKEAKMNALFPPLFKQSFQAHGIYLLLITMILAISATTALKFSNQQINDAVALQAAQMLAGDLLVSDQNPIDDQLKNQAILNGFEYSQATVFSSMAHTQDQFVMVNVKAIDQHFPLRGELQIVPQQKKIQTGEVWLSPRAADLLKVKLGDEVGIADAKFKFTGLIEKDSNQETGFAGFSPTVIISQSDVAKTNAIQVGSRIEYRLLLAGGLEKIKIFEQELKLNNQQLAEKNTNLKIINASEGNTRLMKPMQNLDIFLQLANILTILLCGIAIALTAQRFVYQNQDHIALLRCIGAKKSQILVAYSTLFLVVALLAIFFGAFIGLALGYGLLQLMLQFVPYLNLQFSVTAMLLGPLPTAMFTSMIVLIGFVAPSLLQLLNTAPIQVIRQQKKSVKSISWIVISGAISLILFSIILTQNWTLTLLIIAAILLLSAVLYSLVWFMLKAIQHLKNRFSIYVRIPYQTAFQVTALALGLSLIAVLFVLRTDLLTRWQQQLPAQTPNQFVYGLPPFEVQNFQAQIEKNHWKSTPLYPNIRGRLVAKNNQPFATNLIQTNRSLRRELNLTQTNQFPEDNQIVQGATQFTAINQVSVEQKTAQELGIQVGDLLTFTLPEGQIQAKVINLRTVEWESFSPNFFFIFSPNTMDENAGSYLGSFYVPSQDQAKLTELIRSFANTVFIDIGLILDEVKRLVSVLSQVISLLSFIVGISGVLVLFACLNLLMDERKKEVALLRSFGASKKKMQSLLMQEIGFIGFLAGFVACFFAEIVSAIACYKMNLAIQLHWQIWLILPLAMMIICALIGRYRLIYLTDIPPLQSLREMN